MIKALEEGKRRICQAVSSGSLPHAVLLKGDNYVCREIVMYAAARLFNKSETALDTVGDFYMADGKSLKVANAQEILDNMSVTPSTGKRLIVFSDAGSISVIVQNMLLKTIEEPPPGNFFIFYGNESGLLPTIHSRCANLSLGEISCEDAAEYVKAQGASDEDAMYYARIGQGVENALRLYTNEDYRNYCFSCVDYICSLGKRSMFSAEERTCAQGEAKIAVEMFDMTLSDMRSVKMDTGCVYFSREPYAGRIKECAHRLTDKQINELFRLTTAMHISLNSNSPALQVFDTFAAKAEQVIGYGI